MEVSGLLLLSYYVGFVAVSIVICNIFCGVFLDGSVGSVNVRWWRQVYGFFGRGDGCGVV